MNTIYTVAVPDIMNSVKHRVDITIGIKGVKAFNTRVKLAGAAVRLMGMWTRLVFWLLYSKVDISYTWKT